ncbi:MAG: hypothetical protein H0V27_03090 [Pyrinomonadaceae bacterium]|nr:hypothetical protein [Pyrinomonadaceae bacterium]
MAFAFILGSHAVRWCGVSGATELADGGVALLLDLPRLLEIEFVKVRSDEISCRRPRKLPLPFYQSARAVAWLLWLVVFFSATDFSQAQDQPRAKGVPSPVSLSLPKEIRGYKVTRAQPKIKRTRNEQTTDARSPETNKDELIQLGEPRVSGATPLALTVEVSVTVAPVEQRGQVDFLVFENVRVGGAPVTVEDYNHSFVMPNERPLVLPIPAVIKISIPRLALGAFNQIVEAQDELTVTGRVWVCGRFKKFFATFKRAVPVEFSLRLPNPLRSKASGARK